MRRLFHVVISKKNALELLNQARRLAAQNDLRASECYIEYIKLNPECKQAYEELFEFAVPKLAPYGIKKGGDIDLLRNEYIKRFSNKKMSQLCSPKK